MRIVQATVGSVMIASLETMSQFSLGQFFVKILDRGLAIVEKTAEWSLPCHEIAAEENGKTFKKMELVRPMPWIFFLPSLIILRGLRFVWNVGAFIIRQPEIQPGDIVRCLQKMRRRLRAIRVNAAKKNRRGRSAVRDKSLRIDEAKKSLIRSIQLTLSSLSCLDASTMNCSTPVTRIRLQDNHVTEVLTDERSATESTVVDIKRKFSQVSPDEYTSGSEADPDEPFTEKLNRYADASFNSSQDPSFHLSDVTQTSTSDSDDGEIQVDPEEQRQLMLDLQKKENPNLTELELIDSFDTWYATKKSTGMDGNANCTSKIQSDDNQDFYSPCKIIEEGDSTFYSPMSSKSSSPERDQIIASIELGNNHKGSVVSLVPSEDSKEAMEKMVVGKDDHQAYLSSIIKTNQQRQIPRGRRANHGSRKKK